MDLIDREMALAFPLANDVYDHQRANKDFIAGCESYREWIARLPSAEPQIVHCRDCKNLEIDSIFHDCWCNGHKVWLDHYCGYAERRTDG